MMIALKWSTPLTSGICIAIWILLLALSFNPSTAARSCPRNVIAETDKCIEPYRAQSENMKHSQQKLCCGVDVETLRAFCHSFITSMRCVSGLKMACPRTTHSTIDHVMASLDGAIESLMDLCKDDRMIESYAMHQSCLAQAGRGSESCFHAHLRGSDSVQFLSKVDLPEGQFCSTMRNIVECAEDNVEKTCGSVAAKLMPRLIQPMVKKSSDCDYQVITPTDNKPEGGTKSTADGQIISDQGNQGKGNNKGGNQKNTSSHQGGGDPNAASSVFSFPSALLVFISSLLVLLWKSHTS